MEKTGKKQWVKPVVTIKHSFFIAWDQFNMYRVNRQPTSFPQQIDGHNIKHHMLDVIDFHFKWKLWNKENICKSFSSLTTELQGTTLLMTHDNSFSSVILSPMYINKEMTLMVRSLKVHSIPLATNAMQHFKLTIFKISQ